MSARAMMRMRALVKRNYATERDGFNQKKVDDWRIQNPALPCFAWAGPLGGRHATASGVMVLVVDMPGMLLPKSADLLSGDLIVEVKDRMGTVIFENMLVDSVFVRERHKEARLKAYAELEG